MKYRHWVLWRARVAELLVIPLHAGRHIFQEQVCVPLVEPLIEIAIQNKLHTDAVKVCDSGVNAGALEISMTLSFVSWL